MKNFFYFSYLCLAFFYTSSVFAQDTSDSTEIFSDDSSMLHTYIERAASRMDGKFYKGAVEDYNQAIAISSQDPTLWYQRGLVFEKMKVYKNALEDFSASLTLDSTQLEVRMARARVRGLLNLTTDAILDYTKAIHDNPENGLLYFLRGEQYLQRKQLENACNDFNTAKSKEYDISKKKFNKACKS